MSSHPQPQMPAPVVSPGQAQALVQSMMQAMSALLVTIEQETALVRIGKVREAIALEATKAELSRAYFTATSQVKASRPYLAREVPELLAALQRQHETFRGLLQVNLTVLATAHAVSEGIVRGVNSEMQRRSVPQTYTAYGTTAAPSPRHTAPLAVSRSL